MTVITNYQLMLTGAIKGAEKYLKGKANVAETNLGKARAIKMLQYLEHATSTARNDIALAALYALFGEPTYLPRLYRSSYLAHDIARNFFTGESSSGTNQKIIRTLQSTIFSVEALESAQFDMLSRKTSGGQGYYFDRFSPLLGTRVLLKAALDEMSESVRNKIKAAAANISTKLQDPNSKIDFNSDLQSLSLGVPTIAALPATLASASPGADIKDAPAPQAAAGRPAPSPVSNFRPS